MTALWVRTALAGAGVLALQACAMGHSQYAPYEGYETPPAQTLAKPQYPTSADQPAPPARSADPHDPVAQPSQGVTGQPLPPPGPSSANRSMFIDASTEPALLTEAAYRHVERRTSERHASERHASERHAHAERQGREHGRGHAVRVGSNGRLERSEAPHSVKVRKGDTIDALADRYGTTKAAILKANHIRRPHALKVGSMLEIPSDQTEVASTEDRSSSEDRAPAEDRSETRESRSGSRASSKPYTAQRGDTLYSLGRRYHVPPRTLAELNGLSANAHLHVGQSVKLPGQEEEEAEVAPAPSRRADSTRTRERAHGRFEAPLETPNQTSVGESQASMAAGDTARAPVRPTRMARNGYESSVTSAPAQPVPYDSLPGHLVGPPQRMATSPYSPPQRPVTPPYIPPVSLPQASPTPPDAQIVLAGRGRFIWPVHGPLLSGFGPKPGGQRSDGLDIGAADGAPVHAAAAGDVVYAGDLVPGLGNLVLIKHDDGWITAYAHLSRTEVKIKDHVAQGAEIGLVGQTGGAAQPEVYFEIRYAPTPRDKAKPIDPSLLLGTP